MRNNEKGITLVALVVTIIVLLILAGITITFALNSNGILGRADQAKEQSIIGSLRDYAGMAKANILTELRVSEVGVQPMAGAPTLVWTPSQPTEGEQTADATAFFKNEIKGTEFNSETVAGTITVTKKTGAITGEVTVTHKNGSQYTVNFDTLAVSKK